MVLEYVFALMWFPFLLAFYYGVSLVLEVIRPNVKAARLSRRGPRRADSLLWTSLIISSLLLGNVTSSEVNAQSLMPGDLMQYALAVGLLGVVSVSITLKDPTSAGIIDSIFGFPLPGLSSPPVRPQAVNLVCGSCRRENPQGARQCAFCGNPFLKDVTTVY